METVRPSGPSRAAGSAPTKPKKFPEIVIVPVGFASSMMPETVTSSVAVD